MSTRVEKTVTVNVPISRVYNQWTQFEDFPQFMGGVQSVRQQSDDRLEWVAQIAGVRRTWEAKILEQMPDRKIAWAATEGATNAGAVTFEDVGGDQTSVTLVLEYEPEGLVEKVGDKLKIVENQAESDLDRFKAFIESEGYASGAWRGSVEPGGHVGTPGVEDAAGTQGDDGKAGLSGKAVAAGIGVAAAAAAVAAASRSGSTDEKTMPDMDMSTPVSTTGTGERQAGEPVESDAGWVAPEAGTGGASRETETDRGVGSSIEGAGPVAGAGMGAGMGAGAGMGTGAGLGAGLGAGMDDDTASGSGSLAGSDDGSESGTEWGSEPASESGTGTPIGASGEGHMLSNEEIEDGASDVPLGESDPSTPRSS